MQIDIPLQKESGLDGVIVGPFIAPNLQQLPDKVHGFNGDPFRTYAALIDILKQFFGAGAVEGSAASEQLIQDYA